MVTLSIIFNFKCLAILVLRKLFPQWRGLELANRSLHKCGLRTNANNIKYIILVVGHRLLELLQIIVAAGTQQQGLQILAVQLQHPIAVSHSLPGIADPRVDQSPIIKQFRVDILVVLVDLQGVRVDDRSLSLFTIFTWCFLFTYNLHRLITQNKNEIACVIDFWLICVWFFCLFCNLETKLKWLA